MIGFLLIWLITGFIWPGLFGFFATLHRKTRLMQVALVLSGVMLALTFFLPDLFTPARRGPDDNVGLAFQSVNNMLIAAGVFFGLLIGGLMGRASRDR